MCCTDIFVFHQLIHFWPQVTTLKKRLILFLTSQKKESSERELPKTQHKETTAVTKSSVQVEKFKKYIQILRHPKTGSLYVLVIVLSCPQIGSLSSSTANQRAAQNNYRSLGCQDLYFLNFVTCKNPTF